MARRLLISALAGLAVSAIVGATGIVDHVFMLTQEIVARTAFP